MKKLILLIFIIAVTVTVIVAVTICNLPKNNKPDIVADLNSNCNVDFAFTMEEKELTNLDLYKKHDGFGGYELVSEDQLTSYSFSGYPDCIDYPYKVTGFKTKDAKYSIYGINVGSNIKEADRILKSNGYTSDEEKDLICYNQGVVNIFLYIENDTVYEIYVALTVTNKENVVF